MAGERLAERYSTLRERLVYLATRSHGLSPSEAESIVASFTAVDGTVAAADALRAIHRDGANHRPRAGAGSARVPAGFLDRGDLRTLLVLFDSDSAHHI